jgi:hypothetical protein
LITTGLSGMALQTFTIMPLACKHALLRLFHSDNVTLDKSYMKCLKTPKGQSDGMSRRRAENTKAKGKKGLKDDQ